MTLDASGNLGIGITPSAWYNLGNYIAFQVGNLSLYGRNTNNSEMNLSANIFYITGTGLPTYITSNFATNYQQNNGVHYWYTAPSGTAGNAISFTQAMTLDVSGRLGIGEPSPTEKLHVAGNARITAVGAGAYANDLNITSTGVLTTASSDEKYKYNILPINYGLNTILQLKPVNFQWIKGEENDLGFIAQDVADIIPEAVDTNWNSDLLMRYESLIPILTKAIQEQQALIKALEQRILILENK